MSNDLVHQLQLKMAGDDLARARAAITTARTRARKVAMDAINAGLSEVEVARRLGVDRMSIRNWTGKRDPRSGRSTRQPTPTPKPRR